MNDHVLILNRGVLDADLNAGHLAPPMIELDSAGNLIHSWGDPKLIDPRLHSCYFGKDNNVWIASSPSGMVQKYSHDGSKLLFQIGTKGIFDSSDGTEKGQPMNSNTPKFFMPSSIYEDPQNETCTYRMARAGVAIIALPCSIARGSSSGSGIPKPCRRCTA
jgi:hypothetical protein